MWRSGGMNRHFNRRFSGLKEKNSSSNAKLDHPILMTSPRSVSFRKFDFSHPYGRNNDDKKAMYSINFRGKRAKEEIDLSKIEPSLAYHEDLEHSRNALRSLLLTVVLNSQLNPKMARQGQNSISKRLKFEVSERSKLPFEDRYQSLSESRKRSQLLHNIPREYLKDLTSEREMSNFIYLAREKFFQSILGSDRSLLSSKGQSKKLSLQHIIEIAKTTVENDDEKIYKKERMDIIRLTHDYRKSMKTDIEVTVDQIAEQLELEADSVGSAIDKYMLTKDNMLAMKKASGWGFAGKLISDLLTPLAEEISNLTLHFADKDKAEFASKFLLLSAENLAAIVLNDVINSLMSSPYGVSFTSISHALGTSINNEVNLVRIRNPNEFHQQYLDRQNNILKIVEKAINNQNTQSMLLRRRKKIISRLIRENLNNAEWPAELRAKIGAELIGCLIKVAEIDRTRLHLETPDVVQNESKLLNHQIYYDFKTRSKIGVLELTKLGRSVLKAEKNTNLAFRYSPLPMLIPPVPWEADKGGYLCMKSPLIRSHSKYHKEVLQRSEFPKVLDALTALGEVPWKINDKIFDVVNTVWMNPELRSLADLPPKEDIPVTIIDQETMLGMSKSERIEYLKNKQMAFKVNAERHSLRCDTQYKIDVAREFKDRVFYLPCNLDFRGRTYPIPPHLNHLGNDLCRGLLEFAESRRVGSRGIWWLKVHTANVFGNDKVSFEERAKWADEHIDAILDSASRPLDGDQFWLKAENPWQFLATSFELHRILNSPNPEECFSTLPVHQDGSCNGLQHYAALGRDYEGGKAVNLIPCELPQDVYSGVLDLVKNQVSKDALSGDPLALILDGKLTRKIVKQTVMTSVYGVTFIGARDQILKRLEERDDINWPEPRSYNMTQAATYLTRLTLGSIGDLFSCAKAMMSWMTSVSSIVAGFGHPMCWMTPIGLPVVQPYRRKNIQFVSSGVQQMSISSIPTDESSPVLRRRQSSAFPPNFVHSLDSTHMLRTALRCRDAGLTFASVHDSYWTHASTVDVMNKSLRHEFVQMHSEDILEKLEMSIRSRYPTADFPPLPAKGELDLSVVLESKYFFN